MQFGGLARCNPHHELVISHAVVEDTGPCTFCPNPGRCHKAMVQHLGYHSRAETLIIVAL